MSYDEKKLDDAFFLPSRTDFLARTDTTDMVEQEQSKFLTQSKVYMMQAYDFEMQGSNLLKMKITLEGIKELSFSVSVLLEENFSITDSDIPSEYAIYESYILPMINKYKKQELPPCISEMWCR